MQRILLADQSKNYLQVLRAALMRRFDGLDVDAVHTLESTKYWLHHNQRGLVFMHIKIDGQLTLDLLETTKLAKPAITIITIIEYELPEYRRAALARGADCVIAKQAPLAIEDIMARIEAFVRPGENG